MKNLGAQDDRLGKCGVIRFTTQKSLGAKFKSASADVADKVAKQLVRDLDKAVAPKM